MRSLLREVARQVMRAGKIRPSFWTRKQTDFGVCYFYYDARAYGSNRCQVRQPRCELEHFK